MKVHNFFKKNLSFLVVFVFCYAVMPQVRAQSLVGTWSDLLTELAKPSVTTIQLTDVITVPAGTHSLTSAAGGTVIYSKFGAALQPFFSIRHFLIPNGTVDLTFDNVILDGGWTGGCGDQYETYIGGGIEITGASTEVTLNNVVVQHCRTARVGGGVFVKDGGKLTMNSGVIKNNMAYEGGGGVYIEDNGTFMMYGGVIKENYGSLIKERTGEGGGVECHGTFIMNGDSICNNFGWTGGGICVENSLGESYLGTFMMHGGVISENTAQGDGGGVWIRGTFTMDDGEINGNTSYSYGGGVGIRDGEFIMNNGEINGNMSTMGGGVLVGDNSKFTMNNGEINNNMALMGGGLTFFTDDLVSELYGNEISGNKALLGGGLFIMSGNVIVNGSKIINNFAENTMSQSIIDIFLSNYRLEAIDPEFLQMVLQAYSGTLQVGNGGGGYLSYFGSSLTMLSGEISDNNASNDGGGIYTIDHSLVTVALGAEFSGNTAKQAYWLEQETVGGYDPGMGEVFFSDLKNVIHPDKIKTDSRSNPPAGKAPFQYLYNNYDINMVGTKYHIDTVCFTDSVTLAVTVIDGGENPTYQWFRNGVAVDDSNDSIFKYKAVAGHRDTILCKVYPDIECPEDVYSQIMIVEMLDSLALEQPDNDEVCVGEMVKKITFEGTYDYVKWEVTTGDGMAIGMPANSGIGDISAFTTTNSGVVTITATPVSGKCEGISKTFTITVNPKQKIKATIKVR